MELLATAKAGIDTSDLYVDTATMQIYVNNYWDGKLQKYGSAEKIAWRLYDVQLPIIAEDFFGYEF